MSRPRGPVRDFVTGAGCALLIVAVLFAPLIGVTMLPRKMAHHAAGPGRVRRGFHRLLRAGMRLKWLTIAATFAVFAFSVWAMQFVENQFFPSSDRTELIVDFTLPQNVSIAETRAQMDRFEAALADAVEQVRAGKSVVIDARILRGYVKEMAEGMTAEQDG